MKKNGELKEYSKFNVSEDTEYKWSLELKEKLIKEIQSDNNFTQVVQLARVNLPKNEILDAFESLASSSIKDDILSTIEQLKPLFEADMYIKIIKLFK